MTFAAVELHDALVAARAAEERIREVMLRRFPVGADLSWERSSTAATQHGSVVQHGADDRLQVRNQRTGAVYWIHAWQIAG